MNYRKNVNNIVNYVNNILKILEKSSIIINKSEQKQNKNAIEWHKCFI